MRSVGAMRCFAVCANLVGLPLLSMAAIFGCTSEVDGSGAGDAGMDASDSGADAAGVGIDGSFSVGKLLIHQGQDTVYVDRASMYRAILGSRMSGMVALSRRPSAQHSNHIRPRNDECLVRLEIAHEDRGHRGRDHRGQQIDRRRDVDERKRGLHDCLDRLRLHRHDRGHVRRRRRLHRRPLRSGLRMLPREQHGAMQRRVHAPIDVLDVNVSEPPLMVGRFPSWLNKTSAAARANPGNPGAVACSVEIAMEQAGSPDDPDDPNCPEGIVPSSLHEPQSCFQHPREPFPTLVGVPLNKSLGIVGHGAVSRGGAIRTNG